MTKKAKIITWTSAFVVLVLACAIFFKFYFVFGEGYKTGELNYMMHKGYVFKTYEGKIIQAGFGKAKGTNGALQSYEFEFSVTDKAVADSLMRCSGKTVELHYKQYLGTLPWRGMQRHIVDRIASVKE